MERKEKKKKLGRKEKSNKRKNGKKRKEKKREYMNGCTSDLKFNYAINPIHIYIHSL